MNPIARNALRASLVSLAFLGASAFAQEAASALTRADVVNATLAARANGTLVPAGEGVTPRTGQPATSSALSRATVAAEVRSARAAGELQPAGEAVVFASAQPTATSTTSRAEVKASVMAARRAGELVPAGQGPEASVMALNKQAAAYRIARDAVRAERLAQR